MVNGTILCQPDGHRGCSVCCGLFNFMDISRQSLEAYLKQGGVRTAQANPDDILNKNPDEYPVRDDTSHICPFQGFSGNAPKPGCLLHPSVLPEDRRDLSLFGSTVCGQYICPAHNIFDEEHKQALLKNVDDWYGYNVAVLDPESFIWIIDTAGQYSRGTEDSFGKFKNVIKNALELHAQFLAGTRIPLFFYSVSEYNLNKHRFSLGTSSCATDAHRKSIEASIIRLLL